MKVKPIKRPDNISPDALIKCAEWLKACRHLGWSEDVLPDMEELFWKYRDTQTGELKPKP